MLYSNICFALYLCVSFCSFEIILVCLYQRAVKRSASMGAESDDGTKFKFTNNTSIFTHDFIPIPHGLKIDAQKIVITEMVGASKKSNKIQPGHMIVRVDRQAVVPQVFERGFSRYIDMIIPQEHMVDNIYSLRDKLNLKPKDYDEFAFGGYEVGNVLKTPAVVFDPSPVVF